MEIKPERVEDFLTAMEVDVSGELAADPGCLRFDLLRDATLRGELDSSTPRVSRVFWMVVLPHGVRRMCLCVELMYVLMCSKGVRELLYTRFTRNSTIKQVKLVSSSSTSQVIYQIARVIMADYCYFSRFAGKTTSSSSSTSQVFRSTRYGYIFFSFFFQHMVAKYGCKIWLQNMVTKHGCKIWLRHMELLEKV